MVELDHVVYFTKLTPEEVVAQEKIQGVSPVIGGQHLQWGTHNALLYTDSSYIEWLSVEYQEVAQLSTQPLVKQLLFDLKNRREGFATLCLRTNNIASLNRYFEKMGYKTSGIIEGERQTDTGKVRRWKMLFIAHQIDTTLPYPFFIEWEQDTPTRFAQLKKDEAFGDENELLTIRKCIFQVKNAHEKLTHWSRLLSLPVKDQTLRLPNALFEFQEVEEGLERLHTVIVENK